MRSVDLGLKNAVIVTPVNVLHNWRQEFSKWRPLELKPLRIYMLEDVARFNNFCPFYYIPCFLCQFCKLSGLFCRNIIVVLLEGF